MRILLATDAWEPQVNGVVATYTRLRQEAEALGHEFIVLTPSGYRTVQCPGYGEIRLAVPGRRRTEAFIAATQPDWIHIATEGPVGWSARAYCLRHGYPFTTSYHTRFPEYAQALLSVPASWGYRVLRQFHAKSAGMMVATPSLQRELSGRGFPNIVPWTRGVDVERFHPRPVRNFGSGEPVFLSVGRVSREKNLEAFLDAALPGRKVVVGDGPHLAVLRAAYPDVLFTGRLRGEALACAFASADVFVFPSRTDTFGLVILEAMASGLPVAAYPVTGPIDIVEHGVSGVLDTNLAQAALGALSLDRSAPRRRAADFSWRRAAQMFFDNIRLAETAVKVRAGTLNLKDNRQFMRSHAATGR